MNNKRKNRNETKFLHFQTAFYISAASICITGNSSYFPSRF